MPLYKTLTPNANTTVKIWKITELYETLFNSVKMQPKHLERVLNMKSDLHQRGFLSIRHLLKSFGYTDFDLFYDENGKPHLKDGKYISITHSFEFCAVAVSSLPIGIDIEKQREKITRIAQKFTDYEKPYLTGDAYLVKKLTVVWCVKESLYKLFATPGLSFKEHCLVLPFSFNDTETAAWIVYRDIKQKYSAHFLEFEGFTCAFTY